MKNSKFILSNEWQYVLTYEASLDIYAYGSLRIGIDKTTGQKKISYVR